MFLSFYHISYFQLFAEKTKDVLESPELVAASPATVEAIFKQNDVDVKSEMDFVQALERYIEHQKESDPDIMKKIRPALNCIRFLALTPIEVATTTLLMPIEIRDVIVSQSPKDDFSKMPVGFSLKKNDRGDLVKIKLKLAKRLSSVHFENPCIFCMTHNRVYKTNYSFTTHSFISCTNMIPCPYVNCFKIVYQKYNHCNFLEYSYEDLQKAYDSLRQSKLMGIFRRL